MPLADWSVPFSLRSTPYDPADLLINQQTASGLYLLRPDGCTLANKTRASNEFVPQEDGMILHRRFLAGMQMQLAIQLWEDNEHTACGTLLQTMHDTLMGYLYGLINAGDNEGRIVWTPDGYANRMLDDIRLLTYPTEKQDAGAPYEIGVVLDCELPYSEDETQLQPVVTGTVANAGNRYTYPVWQIYGPFAGFTITDTTSDPDEVLTWDGTQSGAGGAVAMGDYIEIDTFRNSITKVVTSSPPDVLSNVLAGLVMASSDFFVIQPGNTTITVSYTSGGSSNASSRGLINSAWA
jgi:hypothetical protein